MQRRGVWLSHRESNVSAGDGQLVVVKKGTVLAVEAFEGTDKCLARVATGGEGPAMPSPSKSQRKSRYAFDIPCIGTKTPAGLF